MGFLAQQGQSQAGSMEGPGGETVATTTPAPKSHTMSDILSAVFPGVASMTQAVGLTPAPTAQAPIDSSLLQSGMAAAQHKSKMAEIFKAIAGG